MKTEEMPKQALAQLRHQLRTPLNHIIGYSEILLEDATGESAAVRDLLASVLASGQHVLEVVQQCLSPTTGPVTGGDMDALRERIQEPVQSIMRDVGLLLEHGASSDLMDLLRINSAASELLAFALGQPPKETASPAPMQEPDTDLDVRAEVLLVDDDETNRDILSRQLQRIGCAVSTAEDGQAAIQCLGRQTFDVVLLDIIMPGMDGVETLQHIKNHDPAMPVIMISALDEMESVRKCLQLGAEDYLLKPFDPVLLQTRLAAALERSRLRQGERERTKALESALNQLQEVNQDLQQFAYAASHDLQSPIRTVTAMSQLLARRYQGKFDKDADHLIESITGAMRRLNELVDDLLAYSRLSWRGEESPAEFPLDNALEVALANLDHQIRSSTAEIRRDPLPSIVGRKTHFVQLFQNLVGNSLKYRGEPAPVVRILADYSEQECIISVADNGIGFEPQYAGQIFEPFQRLHGYEFPGSGIGLAICSRIVKQYGGRIWAESEKGKGAVFNFSVPARVCRPADNHADTAGSA